jgi:hypothetical protein
LEVKECEQKRIEGIGWEGRGLEGKKGE